MIEAMRSLVVAVIVTLSYATPNGASAVDVVGTRAGCAHRDVASRVHQFADDFSHGRLRRADAAWGSAREFRWYSTTAPGARLKAEAMRRDTLRGYFRQRIGQRERLRVTLLRSFYEKKRDIRHMNGLLVRRARDLPPTVFRFKGALSCRTSKLIVWSMASGDA